MNFGFAMTIIPGLIGLWGAFFLRFGMVAPILLNNFGLLIGLANAMRPMWEPTPPRKLAAAAGRDVGETLADDAVETLADDLPELVGGYVQ